MFVFIVREYAVVGSYTSKIYSTFPLTIALHLYTTYSNVETRMKKNKSQPPPPRVSLPSPIPVRFCENEAREVRQLKDQTGLSLSEIVRRAVRYAAPKFLSGKANISNFPPTEA